MLLGCLGDGGDDDVGLEREEGRELMKPPFSVIKITTLIISYPNPANFATYSLNEPKDF